MLLRFFAQSIKRPATKIIIVPHILQGISPFIIKQDFFNVCNSRLTYFLKLS